MKPVRSRHLLFALAGALALFSAAAPASLTGQSVRAPVVADFVDLYELEEVAISPDGRWVAAVVRDATSPDRPDAAGERRIHLVPADGSAPPHVIAPELGNAGLPQWSADGRLAFLARGEGPGRQVFVYSPASPERGARQATGSAAAVSRFRWSPSGSELAYLSNVPEPAGGWGAPGIWVVDPGDGSARPVPTPGLQIRDLAWSPTGDAWAVIATGGDESGATIRIVDRRGEVRTVADEAGGPGTRRQVLDWSPDGRTILYSRSAPDGRAGQYLGLAPVDGGPGRVLMRDYEGIVMRAEWAPDGHSILAQSFEGLVSRLLRIDPATGSVTPIARILDSYPTFSVAADGATFAYRGERTDGPADVWVLREGAEPRRLTHLNPHLADVILADVRPFAWTRPKDGTLLEAVLVLPPDYRPGTPYPTIVQIHGGPHFHWGLGWLGDWHDWAQLLASRGYVVFLPNPRGSTGRGTDFASAIIQDIGGIDHGDVMSGVDALIEAGIADDARLGVGGWSYGGFLTAVAITRTDRFRAAVVGAGITNLISFAGTPGLGRTWSNLFFPDHPHAAREAYERNSPVANLAAARTPTLVVHGERDDKISVTQAWELHYGLQYLGVETEILIFPRAGHGITVRQDRIEYLEAVLGWFDRHLMGRPAAELVQREAGGN